MTNTKHYILNFKKSDNFAEAEYTTVKELIVKSLTAGNCKASPCYTWAGDNIKVLIDLSNNDENIITAIFFMMKFINESRDYKYAFIQELTYERKAHEGPYNLI